MWARQGSNPSQPQILIRHTCEQSDGLSKFGWIKHDGATFGQQEIIDGSKQSHDYNYKRVNDIVILDIKLETDFVVSSQPAVGDSWTARVSASAEDNTPISLIFYMYHEGRGTLNFTVSKQLKTVSGNSGMVSYSCLLVSINLML